MSMQYQGSVVVGGATIYVTGATVALARTPIIPEIVWGGGWRVNFATGHFDPTFSIQFPWFQSYASGSPSFLQRCIVENDTASGERNNFFAATLFNGGISVTYAAVKCATWSVSGNAMQNDALTCIATFKGKDEPTPSRSGPSASAPTQTLLQTPIPSYLATVTATIGGTNIPSSVITDFQLEVNNNPFPLWTLNGDVAPSDIQLGLLEVQGSYTYYSAGIATAPASSAGGTFVVTFGGVTFTVSSLVYTDDGNDITGPNQKPMRRMRFTAFGTATTPPIVLT